MRRIKLSYVNIILAVLQIPLFLLAGVLEYLSDKKFGVMRYLVFMQHEYESTWFAPQWNLTYEIILFLGVAASFLLLIYLKKQGNRSLAISTLVALLANLTGILFMLFADTEKFMAYYFFLLAIYLWIFLQYLKIILKLKS